MTVTIEPTRDIAACLALRATVFIDEQGVSLADEIDDLDGVSLHLIARDQGRDVGTARVTVRGAVAKLSRVCVLPSHRGTGLGAALIDRAEAEASAAGATRAVLGAQVTALGFYERLGFEICSPVYDDAGIPHRDMQRAL